MAKIGLKVPTDDQISFTDENGKLHYYRIPYQDGEQGDTMVFVNNKGAIDKVNVSHKAENCNGSFDLVENGKVLGTYSDKLAEMPRLNKKLRLGKLNKPLKQRKEKQQRENLLII